ncbi:MAG: DUF1016 N-terminal domain-containing protein, partial [Euryarchaeota archaeon]|nr:DUF1016 N-terminal domain-containing protein [Euryarchaeota archaeon]
MAQIQTQKVVKKQELGKKRGEGLEGYTEILQDIKSLLEKARYRAYKAVDNLRVQTYWQIGDRIVRGELQHRERADYGERVIENLSIDLDIQRRDIYRMVQFYRTYPIVTSLMSQLSWTHYTVLITITDNEKRRFYEAHTIQNAWSVRELRKQIRSNLYERMKRKGEVVIAPITRIVEPEQVFKDIYNFDFLKIKTEQFKHAYVSQMYSYLNWYKEHKWQEGQRQPIGLIICKT